MFTVAVLNSCVPKIIEKVTVFDNLCVIFKINDKYFDVYRKE